MASASDIAKLCGVSTAKVDEIFDVILRLAAKGERVTIRGFGVFERFLHKGRVQVTPLVKDGSVEYGDRYLFKFRAGRMAKNRFDRKAHAKTKRKK